MIRILLDAFKKERVCQCESHLLFFVDILIKYNNIDIFVQIN